MQWQNDPEIPTSSESHGKASDVNSSRYYAQSSSPQQPTSSSPYYEQPSSAQAPFQQQMYYSAATGYSASSHPQPSVAALPPITASQLAAIFSYSFGWVTGLLFVLFGGQDRFLRFHALQSFFFFGGITVMDIGLFRMIFNPWYEYDTRFIPYLCLLLVLALNGVGVVAWIVAMIQAGRGAYFKLPIVGELLARRMNLRGVPRQ